MRKIFVAIFVIFSCVAYADTTLTSKNYVDDQVATKQDIVPAKDTNTVLTHTGESGNIGEKGIYDATGDYLTQQHDLVTAGVADSAIQNAIDTEFVCVEWHENDAHTDANCLGWQIRTKDVNMLPTGYTQLEYLESTGTQYIDMGITVKANTLAEFEYQFKEFSGSNYVFGQVAGSALSAFGYRASSVGMWWFNRRNQIADVSDLLKHKVVYNTNGKAYRDNELVATRGTFAGTNNLTILLFAERSDNNHIYKGKVKIYYFILKEGSNTVRNFIPARRNSDDVLGMYDLVSNTFFTNAGTGTFIAGPDLNVFMPNGN